VARFTAPAGAGAAPPSDEDLAALSAGGEAARQLLRARLDKLTRLVAMSQAEGISVVWLHLGGGPQPEAGAAVALWLELLRMLR